MELFKIVFFERKSATPKSTVNVRCLVPVENLGLGGAVYWGRTGPLSRLFGECIDFAASWHVMEQLRVEGPAAQAGAWIFATQFRICRMLGVLPFGRRRGRILSLVAGVEKGDVEGARALLGQFWRRKVVEESFGGGAGNGVSEGAEGELGAVHNSCALGHA